MVGWIAMVLLAVSVVACGDENGAPSLGALEVTTDEDTPVELHVLDQIRDPDGDALAVTAASAPGHGAEVVAGATIVVTPMHDFHGEIAVEYEVSDHTRTVTGHATVTVRPVNDAPVAAERTVAVHRITAIELAGTDVDGDALTYEVVTPPAHGTVTGAGPTLQYAPASGYVGTDVIAYVAHDASAASPPATVHLDVTLGAAPVAVAGSASGFEDVPLPIVLQASDPDGDPLTFTIEGTPAHGTLTGAAPNLTFTPEANYAGPDQLSFRATDGTLTSSTVTVAIQVTPVNDLPVATPQTVTATEDLAATVVLHGSDVDGDALTFQIQTAPAHGTLSGSGATRTYTPEPDYHGPDSFSFVALDGAATSAPATVTIAVASVNDVPTAEALTKTVAEDSPVAIMLAASDVDGDPLTFAIAQQPAHGTLIGTPPLFTYVPDANFNGSDSLRFTASDGALTSAPATLTITVTPVNDAPVATDSAVTTGEDTPIAITLQATDVDGTTPSFSIVSAPADGTLTGVGAVRTYTPALNATGTRTLTFSAADGLAGDSATVTITITPVNDPPVARTDFVATDPAEPLTIDALRNDTDVEGDALELDAVGAPAHGTADIVGDELVYTPAAGFTGTDTFTYTAIDGHGGSATSSVIVGVGTFPTGAPRDETATIGAFTITNFSLAPAISGDGRYIAFVAGQPLVPEDTNGATDIYVFDRGTRTTSRVSVATGGGQSNGGSFRPHLSEDGRFVVFDSEATNLVTGDTNARFDVFRHDRVTGTTVRISVSGAGAQANSDSSSATISEDGNSVAFASSAFNLIPDDANGAGDVFVRDVAAGTTTRVSVSATGGDADLASTEPMISGDGQHVAFVSTATNLVAGDSNGLGDVFVRDLVAGTTTRVSVSSTGTQANGQSTAPSLSASGRFVSFISNATNLVPGVADSGLLYVRDLQSVTTTFVPSAPVRRARLSGDGRYAAIQLFTGVFLRDRFGGGFHTPAGSSTMAMATLSANGRYAVVLDSANGGKVVVIPNPL